MSTTSANKCSERSIETEQKQWIPERGFIVSLSDYVSELNQHEIIGEKATTPQVRNMLRFLFDSEDQFDLMDFIHDIEIDLSVDFSNDQIYMLEDYFGNCRDELQMKFEEILGEGYSTPVFQKWIYGSDALFYTVEGAYHQPGTLEQIRDTPSVRRRLGVHNRFIRLSPANGGY